MFIRYVNTRGEDESTVFVETESRSILYSTKMFIYRLASFLIIMGLWLNSSELMQLTALIAGTC